LRFSHLFKSVTEELSGFLRPRRHSARAKEPWRQAKQELAAYPDGPRLIHALE
jgi:hypothetical protein